MHKSEMMHELKMIISETVGCRAQMDLIHFNRFHEDGYCWILRCVDHHSSFGNVAALKSNSSKEVTQELIKILGSAVRPQVLQSNNGTKFLGECIRNIRKYFPTIQIVKERSYHPQSQGSVERSNVPFKEALVKWVIEKPGASWAHVRIHVVNQAINGRPSWSKDNLSPYHSYYGKLDVTDHSYVLDDFTL
jgi:hypothetical protein